MPRDTVVDRKKESVSDYPRSLQAPMFLKIQVSRKVLNDAISNLNAFAAPLSSTPSALLVSADEIVDIIAQGSLSKTVLLSCAHLKRIEVSPDVNLRSGRCIFVGDRKIVGIRV